MQTISIKGIDNYHCDTSIPIDEIRHEYADLRTKRYKLTQHLANIRGERFWKNSKRRPALIDDAIILMLACIEYFKQVHNLDREIGHFFHCVITAKKGSYKGATYFQVMRLKKSFIDAIYQYCRKKGNEYEYFGVRGQHKRNNRESFLPKSYKACHDHLVLMFSHSVTLKELKRIARKLTKGKAYTIYIKEPESCKGGAKGWAVYFGKNLDYSEATEGGKRYFFSTLLRSLTSVRKNDTNSAGICQEKIPSKREKKTTHWQQTEGSYVELNELLTAPSSALHDRLSVPNLSLDVVMQCSHSDTSDCRFAKYKLHPLHHELKPWCKTHLGWCARDT